MPALRRAPGARSLTPVLDNFSRAPRRGYHRPARWGSYLRNRRQCWLQLECSSTRSSTDPLASQARVESSSRVENWDAFPDWQLGSPWKPAKCSCCTATTTGASWPRPATHRQGMPRLVLSERIQACHGSGWTQGFRGTRHLRMWRRSRAISSVPSVAVGLTRFGIFLLKGPPASATSA